MTVITSCDTYDLFHVWHFRLLERAKELMGESGNLIVAASRIDSTRRHYD